MQTNFLPLVRVFLFAVPPVAPFVGASDIGQGYTRPKTGDQGQGTKPWTHKKIVLHGQGFEPWTHKIDRGQGQGFEPLTDQKDHLYNHALDR